MMIKEYKINISEFDDEERYKLIFDLLPKHRQEKLLKYKEKQDRLLSLASGYLFKKALTEFGLSEYEDRIVYNEYGKPYIENNPMYFSISHSGDMAYLVFCDCEVGCDIEKIDDRKYMELAQRFFCSEEYQYLKNSENSKNDFFKLWTIKESYLKEKGTGLYKNLNSFCVYINKKEIDDSIIYKSEIEDGYAYAIVIRNNGGNR